MLRKYSIRNNESGITLMEVIVSISISVIIAVGAIWALIAFFNKYEEYNLRTYLYQESFNTLTQIKGGIPLGSGTNTYFYGVNSASKLRITRGFSDTIGKGIMTIPSIQIGGYFDNSEFYFNDGKILGTYFYRSVAPPSPIVLFPKKHRDKIFVTDFRVVMLNDPIEGEEELYPGKIVEITIEAELRNKGKIFPCTYRTKMSTFK